MSIPRGRTVRIAAAAVLAAGVLAACGGSGGPGGGETPRDDKAITVLMVDNPQMLRLQKLTAKHFTGRTGIEVDFTTLPENEVRGLISQDFANQTGRYDVATISNYEARNYAGKGWLRPLDSYISKDESFDQSDILLPMQLSLSGANGKVYAEPFYGESSMLMYRKDVFARLGLEMPANPSWRQVARLAERTDGAEAGMRGICLRGLPGWSEMIAPLSTLVNTFGGTWFDKDWNARLTSPGFTEAAEFYVRLVREHGESRAAQAGYAECLSTMRGGKSAMWYDATAGAGSLEADTSPVKGKIGYVPAPVEKTESAGWLHTWAWSMQKASQNTRSAWKFISWASGKDYERLVGETSGWADVPAGKRASTYENPEYKRAAKAFHKVSRDAIRNADPRDPGVQQRPTLGIQFVAIPEFSELGGKVSRELSAAIEGEQSVKTALRKAQKDAQEVGDTYKRR